jgi:hypothetical protein
LLSTDIQTEIQRNRILPVVMYGCETWSPKLRAEHRLRVLENRVLRRRRKQQKNGENCIMSSFSTCSAHHTSFMLSKHKE